MRAWFVLGISALGLGEISSAGPQHFESGEERVLLLELYTSQGCSSCPPAERWLNGFELDERLWKEIVPIAFHVDYWDRLGWKDPFASFENTSRQYGQHQAGNVASVYTPGFVVNGKEWRGWFDRRDLPIASGSPGNLSVSLDDGGFRAKFEGGSEAVRLNVAILGIDLRTKVTRGENLNRSLRQSFVSLAHQTFETSNGIWEGPLPLFDRSVADRFGIAVWITAKGELKPIQAVGAWLSLEALD